MASPVHAVAVPQAIRRVLIVDDQAVSRELIRLVLESVGCEVIEAADGEEGLSQAFLVSPSMILLDLHMPRRDGMSVLAELRNHPRFMDTPVIAVTASAMNGDRQKGLAAGFTEYLTKPVSLVALRGVVTRFL